MQALGFLAGGLHPLPNSFAIKVRLLQFYTVLLWDIMNNLGQNNQDQIDNDITMMSPLLC